MIAMDLKIRSRNPGFTLVEVLVGMVMGLIVVLVIMQALSVAEGYKRTTTNGSDAQVNGLLAIRTLESQIRMAGYGLTGTGVSLCPSIESADPTNPGNPGPPMNSMPVKLVDGGSSSDTIEVLYSGSAGGSAPIHIRSAMPSPSNDTPVNTVSGINTCDFVLLASPTGNKICTLQQVTNTQPNGNGVHYLTSSGQSNYDPPGGQLNNVFPNYPGYTTSDIVVNIGNFVDRRFSVYKNGSNDEFYLRNSKVNSAADGCQTDPNPPNLDMFSNVVYMKAQYGIANLAPGDTQQVYCWTGAATTDTGCSISSGNWSAPPASDVNRIKAIRLVLVVRSQLSEKPSTGTTCDTTTTSNVPISWTSQFGETVPTIDLSGVPNWQCYRYKAYRTVVPMINVIWSNT
jgi:type IV pilus assembly protein PilW